MVNVICIKIIEKICKLAYNRKNNSRKTQKNNDKKLNWYSSLYRSLWIQQQKKTQPRLFNKLAHIKTEEKRYRRITDKNKKVA